MDEKEKNIDESWKEAAEKEKQAAKQAGGKEIPEMPAPTFSFFIATVALQAAISLGQVENPATDKKEENLPQAKFIIDTLDMLKQKTQGNLDKDEQAAIENILYELKMNYVAKTRGENK
ncbi:MAG: DUF1844 domain-containing protein [Candidatus Omnitrophota bacterium]